MGPEKLLPLLLLLLLLLHSHGLASKPGNESRLEIRRDLIIYLML